MTNSRRTFIKQSSVVLAGAALLPSIHIEAHTINKQKLAIQLFSLEKEMITDAKTTLQCLSTIGYQYIEHSNYRNRHFYGYTPSDFRRLVNDSGLRLLSGHTVLELKHWVKKSKSFTKEWHYVLEDANKAGQQFIITPWLDKSLWNDETGLKNFLEVLNKSGELCRKAGLQFGYHNHDFEFSNYIKNRRLYDIILQNTEPYLVTQQLDIGNMHNDSYSITDLFKTYPGRFRLLHIKNITESGERHEMYKPAALDEGLLDVTGITEQARLSGGTTVFIMDQGNYGATSVMQSTELEYKIIKHNLTSIAS